MLLAMVLAIFAFPIAACTAWLVGVDPAGGSCPGALGLFAWYGTAVVVPASVLFGLPLLLLARWRGWTGWWQIGLCGFAVGVLAAVSLDLLDSFIVWYKFALLSAPLGFLAGLLFWLVGVYRNVGPDNSFEPTPLRGAAEFRR
ncbi:hypothetical protein LU699_05680 [Luteimonas fraxinea]|uniref:Uncharacterized protein n=1 Tax=Luteimonas fraxinea TaxID=2901869 RepID=A0ABS8UA22_9GAMM|nr:hypothetical protein [Luteimonas fraxinea]MCD9095599.1 hypothetical protein [Luteimonas fraxinea]MCD9124181.1 hypothetical protein [Luteimonas fraxinea]UHH11205.1 hypothetical protein LU699_05680 [Luteimonas fraxinea]